MGEKSEPRLAAGSRVLASKAKCQREATQPSVPKRMDEKRIRNLWGKFRSPSPKLGQMPMVSSPTLMAWPTSWSKHDFGLLGSFRNSSCHHCRTFAATQVTSSCSGLACTFVGYLQGRSKFCILTDLLHANMA